MSRTIAFLRAINVGGHTVTMQRLRALFEELELTRVETFIASGNVMFDTPRGSAAALAKKIEAHLRDALGYEVVTFLRTDAELAGLVRRPAFDAAERRSARVYVVGFLAAPLGAAARKALAGLEPEGDVFRPRGHEFHWLCRTGQGQSDFSNAVFEKATRVRTTFRGMNTLERLSAKYPPKAGA